VTDPSDRGHYSYTYYADPAAARSFDDRRFGGPIGQVVAASQAAVLFAFVGPIRGKTVLDVGTGTGRAALLLAGAGAKATGIDASDQMLAVARRRAVAEGCAVDLRVGDAHHLDFADQSFDVVVSFRVLMHTPGWRSCVAELCRVARDRVVFDYPSACSAAAVQSLTRRVLYRFGRTEEPYRVFSDREIDAELRRAGFRIVSVHRQFVLPIALHKALGSPAFTTSVEGVLARVGVLRWLGSPVTLVAERCASS
jgi:ubiquinone/menaquinone biosynthesis C-methylase UbiE